MVEIHREMGFGHSDVLRLLPSALTDHTYSIADNQIVIAAGEQRVEIELEPEGERQIATMRVPVTTLHFRFAGYQQSEINAFMTRFLRAFQGGGG